MNRGVIKRLLQGVGDAGLARTGGAVKEDDGGFL